MGEDVYISLLSQHKITQHIHVKCIMKKRNSWYFHNFYLLSGFFSIILVNVIFIERKTIPSHYMFNFVIIEHNKSEYIFVWCYQRLCVDCFLYIWNASHIVLVHVSRVGDFVAKEAQVIFSNKIRVSFTLYFLAIKFNFVIFFSVDINNRFQKTTCNDL